MGLIHSRASKKRDKAEAELAREETRQLRDERRREAAGDSALLQPTLRDTLRVLGERRRASREQDTD